MKRIACASAFHSQTAGKQELTGGNAIVGWLNWSHHGLPHVVAWCDSSWRWLPRPSGPTDSSILHISRPGDRMVGGSSKPTVGQHSCICSSNLTLQWWSKHLNLESMPTVYLKVDFIWAFMGVKTGDSPAALAAADIYEQLGRSKFLISSMWSWTSTTIMHVSGWLTDLLKCETLE